MVSLKLARRPALAAMAMVLALGLNGCAPKDAGALVASAHQQYQRGELRAAVIQLKNALQQQDGFEARRLLGEVYLEQGDAVSAEKELRRALAMAPPAEAGRVRAQAARALLMQGQYQRALDEARAIRTLSAESLALRGDALAALGKLDEARAAYLDAHARGPRAADPLLGLARLAVLDRHPQEADAFLARALAAQPGHLPSLRLRGDRLRAAGKPAEALASYRQILALRPDDSQAHTDLAGLYADQGKFDQARSAIAQARKAGGNTLAVHYASAMLSYREGKPAEARDAVQQILKVAPEHPAGLLLAATVELDLGADEQAERHLKTYLAAHPHDLYAAKRLALVHLRAGRLDATLKLVEPLAAAHPNDVEVLTLAGEAQLRAQRYNEAARWFEQASARAPGVAQLHTELALSRLGGGEPARAIADLERAVQLDGGSERNGILLVMAHLRAGAPQRALEVVAGMEARADNPVVQNLKGGVYLALQDTPRAHQSFERALALEPAYLPALANLAQLDRAAGRADDARQRYQAALVRAPDSAELMEALAGLASGRGRHQEALAWMERAARAQPELPRLALQLAGAYLRAGQPAKALLLTRQFVASHPEHAGALQALADLQWQSGELDGAAASYARLAVLTPAAPAVHLRLATVSLARGNASAAKAALHKALALAPDAFDAQLTLVQVLLAEGRHGDALALAATAQRRQPKSPNGYKLEGDIQAAQGKHAAALAAYERAFALGPTGPALLQLHGALVKLGQPAAAEARLRAWLDAHPEDIATRTYAASTRLVAGDAAGAIAELEAVLAVDRDNVVALNDLAWAHGRLGHKQALEYAQRAYRLAPDNPSVIDTLGWLHLELGQPARALPLLRKAAALAPQAPDIQLHLASGQLGAGDKAGARRTLQALLDQPRHASRHPEARALLAKL